MRQGQGINLVVVAELQTSESPLLQQQIELQWLQEEEEWVVATPMHSAEMEVVLPELQDQAHLDKEDLAHHSWLAGMEDHHGSRVEPPGKQAHY